GIAGFFLSGIFLFSFSKNKPLVPVVFVFLVAATVWLYFGMLINKKLKSKNEKDDLPGIRDERLSYRQIDFILTVALFAVIFLGISHWKYMNYLAIPFLLSYFYWFYLQMKLLNNYFKS
ncbi:MAG: hypothetical protein NT126_03470, partial [Bacteroidetes bacterium]|nr:hypothetical protein [Bacteroidota bacterium]